MIVQYTTSKAKSLPPLYMVRKDIQNVIICIQNVIILFLSPGQPTNTLLQCVSFEHMEIVNIFTLTFEYEGKLKVGTVNLLY